MTYIKFDGIQSPNDEKSIHLRPSIVDINIWRVSITI